VQSPLLQLAEEDTSVLIGIGALLVSFRCASPSKENPGVAGPVLAPFPCGRGFLLISVTTKGNLPSKGGGLLMLA
jgi:hypothetical protein